MHPDKKRDIAKRFPLEYFKWHIDKLPDNEKEEFIKHRESIANNVLIYLENSGYSIAETDKVCELYLNGSDEVQDVLRKIFSDLHFADGYHYTNLRD